ncbi:MAG: SgcJ/EcaC family oxidoreductase [Thermoguttaceae bacterium]
MRSILTAAGVALALVATAVVLGPQKTVSGDSPAKPDTAIAASAPGPAHQQDEKAIRLAVEAFAKAYNAGDAKAIARRFVADGEVVSEEGQSTQGREGIEQVFAGIFKEHPKTHMDLAIESIRFVGPDMAVEDGMTTVTHGPDEPAQHSPYSVVHARHDGKWLMASSRDLPDDTLAPEEQLKQLQWMVGEWIDESPEAVVMTSYRWTDNQCYILSEFKVQVGGRPVMTGTQRIGWDPLAKKIRSWVFDSEGGFGEGIWTREGKQWIVKMTGVTRDGKIASATNITTRVSKDRMTWQQRDRIVGGEKTPDIAETPITRKPPPPK